MSLDSFDLAAVKENPYEFPKARVQEHLEGMFDARREQVAKLGIEVTEATSYLERFVLDGGKRVRPHCAWLGYVAGGGLEGNVAPEQVDSVLRAISALELIQACALIHDDIIDSSDTRRGAPTVHRLAEADHRERAWLGSSEHFGTSVAILVGDLSLCWADDLLINSLMHSGLDFDALRRALPAWQGMRTEVIGGQLLDISLEASGSDDPQRSATVNRFKTAAYTIERPLHIGAAIAGASKETIDALRGFGRDIGMAFQLRDDLLGVYGDPAITGKPAGDDLREGKRTVLVATAIERAANEQEAKRIREAVGNVHTAEDIAALAELIASTGAPEVIEQQIGALTEQGLAHLQVDGLAPQARAALAGLADRVTKRKA